MHTCIQIQRHFALHPGHADPDLQTSVVIVFIVCVYCLVPVLCRHLVLSSAIMTLSSTTMTLSSTAMTAPWPQWMTNSLQSATQPEFANDERPYYGPYIGVDGPFEVGLQRYIPDTPRDAFDVVAMFTVEVNKHPVLFIQVKPPSYLRSDSQRRRSDDQMRDHFRDLRTELITPRLPGISAFGTRLAFYEYTAATNVLTPRAIAPNPNPDLLSDTVPAEQWNYDILEAAGIDKMRETARDVRTMCAAAID